MLLLLMRILSGVYGWFSFLLSWVGVGTPGFEQRGMSCINLCSPGVKPFLQELPGCALADNLLFLEEDQSPAEQVLL